jgi:hypothetical protein
MARCGCGVAESTSVGCPRGRWIQCRLKTEDAPSTPSAQRLLLSFLLLGFALSWCPIAAPVAAPAAAYPLPTSWPASAPIAAPLAVPPVCWASLSSSVAACAMVVASARPTAAQIDPRRRSPAGRPDPARILAQTISMACPGGADPYASPGSAGRGRGANAGRAHPEGTTWEIAATLKQ